MQINWPKFQFYSNFLSKFAQSPLYLTSEQSFYVFSTKENAVRFFFDKVFKAESGSAKNECRSTALLKATPKE